MIVMALDPVRGFFHSGAMVRSPTNMATTTPAVFPTVTWGACRGPLPSKITLEWNNSVITIKPVHVIPKPVLAQVGLNGKAGAK